MTRRSERDSFISKAADKSAKNVLKNTSGKITERAT